jgi:hypothetical protein
MQLARAMAGWGMTSETAEVLGGARVDDSRVLPDVRGQAASRLFKGVQGPRLTPTGEQSWINERLTHGWRVPA